MHTRQRFGLAVLVATLALLLGGSGQARAGVIITFSQDGNNVVANGSGSFKIMGTSGSGVSTFPSFVDPSGGAVIIGPAGSHTESNFYFFNLQGPTEFGAGPLTAPDSGSGDSVGIAGAHGGLALFVTDLYQSGSPLTATSTWDNTTISGLGLTPGTYEWTWGSVANGTADDLKVVVPGAASAVPEPAALTLLATGALGLLGYSWRRQKRQPE